MSSLVIQQAAHRVAELRSALAARVVIADGAMGTYGPGCQEPATSASNR